MLHDAIAIEAKPRRANNTLSERFMNVKISIKNKQKNDQKVVFT